MVLANSEDNLQWAICKLLHVAEYNLQILISKTKIMAFRGNNLLRSKIVINN